MVTVVLWEMQRKRDICILKQTRKMATVYNYQEDLNE
jgi:hypothetical protein